MGLGDLLKVNNGLHKLVIIGYNDAERSDAAACFVPLFNPTDVSWEFKAKLTPDNSTGVNQGRTQQFNGNQPQTMSLKLLFDATNTSPFEGEYPTDKGEPIVAYDIIEEDGHVDGVIQQLSDHLQKVQSEIHAPYYLQVVWGSKVLNCAVQNMDVTYKLFNAGGLPIRAEVNISFIENRTREEQNTDPEPHSPNLTHLRVMEDHLTLPLMAQQVYEDPRYYIQLAGINKITNLRKRGSRKKLVMPPFDKKSK